MMKRFFASLACVFLFAAALAGSALASSSAWQISVGGETINGSADAPGYARVYNSPNRVEAWTNTNFDPNRDPWHIKWDGSTLTLKEVSFDANKSSAASGIVYNYGSLTIELIGDNTIIGCAGQYGGASPAIGVYYGGLTITGDGTLKATGGGIKGTYNVNRSYGIYANGDVTVNGGTITATGGYVQDSESIYSAYPASYGIFTNGRVNVTAGDVTAVGGESEGVSYGILTENSVSVSGGELTATGGKSAGESFGILAGSVNVTGGDVYVNGGETTSASYGIRAGSVEVTGGYIYANDSGSATVTETSGSSYGIYSMGSVTIGDPDTYTGAVNAYGARATGSGSDSYGIYARGNVVTRGFANVTATGGEAGNDSFGISAGGNVEMSGNSTVDASGGSFGIRAGSGVTWSGYGDITAGGGTAGISAEGDVTMSGYGDVTATGDMAVSDSCGIRSERGNVAISNGTIEASGSDSGISAEGGGTVISGGEVSAKGGSFGIANATISGGSVTASGGSQAINSCNISPVSGTTPKIMGGEILDGSGAGDVTADANLSAYKYLKITFDVPESEIMVGNETLNGSSAASAYATTDADGTVTTTGATADNYNIKWDGATLTLKDATISGNIDHNSSNVTSIRLVIEGENSIATNNTSAYNGIFANSTGLTISGDGTLEISASTTGINVYSLTIESGTLKITAGQYGVSARAGVSAKAGVTIRGGEVEVSGGTGAFDSNSDVTVDPREGKQICVSVGESEADAKPLGPYTSEDTILYIYTVNKYFRSYTEDAPIVTGVSISPAGATVEAGKTVQFSASVSGTGGYDDSVTWSVSGRESDGTSISADGLLTVAADETAESLTVMATASGDSSKSASATVAITQPEPEPTITGVTINPSTATVEAGKTVQFNATVNGTGGFSQEVTWSVSGGVSAGTSISANGLLTVAADETAESLTVTATASGDSGIYGTATVTVTQPSTPDEPDVPVWPVFPGGSTGPDEPEKPEDEGLPFIDVHEGDWFYENVGYVYENGLMNGVSETLFEPNGTVTRGMIVTILHRLEGEPESDYDMPFTDVAEQQWYAGAVRWAAGEGIVTGVSATEFAPDDPITREQFAAILWRYAQSKGYDVSASADLTGFLDYGQISEYALPALQWAVGAGVMSGRGDGILAPQGTATRAEAAAMLMRFVENVK